MTVPLCDHVECRGTELCACVYELNELCKNGTGTRLLGLPFRKASDDFAMATCQPHQPSTGENELDMLKVLSSIRLMSSLS